MTAFSAFGALIHSAVPLAFSRQASPVPPCINIELHPDAITVPGHGLKRTGDEIKVWWEPIGEFTLRPSGTISVRAAPHAAPKHLTIALSGVVMALQMHLMGKFVLHGNALSMGQRGFVIVGNK